MKRVLLAAALVAALLPPPSAHAEEIPLHVVEAEHVRMQLMPGACRDARSLSMTIAAGDEYAARWRAIRSTWRGRDGSWREFAGCWLELSAKEAGAPGEVLVLIFEDGDRYVVLKSELLGLRRGSQGT